MRISLLLLFAVMLAAARGQYTIDWSHPASDTYKNGVMAARDTADNVVVVGTRTSFVGVAHIYTQKYDKDGNLLWEQVDSTGVESVWEQPTWVTTSSTNNIFVSGYMYTGTTNIFTDSVVVLKYDPMGNLQWRRVVGPSFIFGVQVRCVVDEADNLYVGASGLIPSGFHLIKYDANGNEIFHELEPQPMARTFSSMLLHDDRLVLVGNGVGAVRGAVASWSTDGTFLWGHTLVGYGGQDLAMDGEGRTYVLTSFEDISMPQSDRDAVIKVYDAGGDSITQYVYDFNGTDQPARMSLVNGRITATGWTIPPGGGYMNWTTFQLDLDGTLLWNATYDAMISNDEIPGWLAVRENGDVYVTGKGGPLFQGQYLRYVTLKYSNGVQQWVHTDPYYGYNGVACVLGKDSAVYVLGYGSMTLTRYLDDLSTGLNLSDRTQGLEIFPVPASDRLFCRRTAVAGAQERFTIIDITGQEVHQGALDGRDTGIDISHLPNGVYIVNTSEGSASRFVVQR